VTAVFSMTMQWHTFVIGHFPFLCVEGMMVCGTPEVEAACFSSMRKREMVSLAPNGANQTGETMCGQCPSLWEATKHEAELRRRRYPSVYRKPEFTGTYHLSEIWRSEHASIGEGDSWNRNSAQATMNFLTAGIKKDKK
jgi:hypothetical protein